MVTAEDKDGPILASPYKDVPLPEFTAKNVCEFLLPCAKENVKAGRNNWVTNTVTGETMKFEDLDRMTKSVGSAMVRRGMKKGDVAIYLTMDVTRIYPVMMGIWRIGGIFHSSYPEDTYDTLLSRIKDTGAKWIICDPVSLDQVQKATKSVEWPMEIFLFGQHEDCTSINELFDDDGTACPCEPVGELDDPVLILCTSGTTGLSKGAIYTNKSVLSFCTSTDAIPYHDAPALYVVRCTHVLGALFPVRNIINGTWSTMMSPLTKTALFEAVHKYKPFLAFGFPTYLALLVKDPEAKNYDFSSLEFIATGGIVLTPQYYSLMMSLPGMKAVINGLGMTECCVMTTTVDLEYSSHIRTIPNLPYLSVGRLYPNSYIKILDIDTGKALGAGKSGEIVVKSQNQAVGYWKREEETKSTFKDGWLRTGDLGYYDEDGNVFIVDRIKDTFKYFNNHISPAELEEVVLRHPEIAEASCFGIPDPAEGDRVPRLVVVLRPGATITTETIRKFVDEQVASYKQIRGGVYIVDALPRGKTGKVARNMVAQMQLTH